MDQAAEHTMEQAAQQLELVQQIYAMVVEFLVQYSFQVVGAIFILIAGVAGQAAVPVADVDRTIPVCFAGFPGSRAEAAAGVPPAEDEDAVLDPLLQAV